MNNVSVLIGFFFAGVTTNVLFMALVFALSWYHLQLETDEEEILKGENKPLGAGTENFIFDSDDFAPETLSIKQEDGELILKIFQINDVLLPSCCFISSILMNSTNYF